MPTPAKGEAINPFCAACAPLLDARPTAPTAIAAAAYDFGGPMADAIHRLKYEGRTELGGPLGRLLAQAVAPWVGLIDAVVPVPLHGMRLRERGYNQSGLLARPVARGLGAEFVPTGLARLRPTPPQVGLSASLRSVNVRGAFAARRSFAGRSVLLIDDVRTTGATLAECAHALRAAQARTVHTAVLAAAT